jgi:hypothetical protein
LPSYSYLHSNIELLEVAISEIETNSAIFAPTGEEEL